MTNEEEVANDTPDNANIQDVLDKGNDAGGGWLDLIGPFRGASWRGGRELITCNSRNGAEEWGNPVSSSIMGKDLMATIAKAEGIPDPAKGASGAGEQHAPEGTSLFLGQNIPGTANTRCLSEAEGCSGGFRRSWMDLRPGINGR